jgi:hypothetical protein
VNCCFLFQAQNLKIIQKPIDYSKEKIKLSLEYIKEHHGLDQKTPKITPKIIVLHYTAGGKPEINFKKPKSSECFFSFYY